MAERLLQREVRPAPELDLDDDLAVRTWIMQDTDDDLRAGRTAPESRLPHADLPGAVPSRDR